jgi:hypothetical protein
MKNSTIKPSAKPMKRSGFKKKTDWKPLAKGASKLKPIGARAKRTRQGKVAPNAEEQAWLNDIVSCGCLICWMQKMGESAAEVHHLKVGDRRIGHMASIAICPPHHRGGAGEGSFISRHPYKARWERAYGKEADLLEIQKGRVAVLRAGRAINRLKGLANANQPMPRLPVA